MNKRIVWFLSTFYLSGIISALIYAGITIYLENGHKREKALINVRNTQIKKTA